MPVYKLTIEYDGTSFSGWQKQDGQETVEGVLRRALDIVMRGRAFVLQGASRTDAGVHALGQVASLNSDRVLEPYRLAKSLCALCRPHVAVTSVIEMPETFNARFDSRGKHYVYRILRRQAPSPLKGRYCWHVRAPLDVSRMEVSAEAFVGTHDYRGFRSSDCGRQHTERTVWSVGLEPLGDQLNIHVKGDAFLKNMVRIMVGTLVDIGRGVLSVDQVSRVLASGDRREAGRTAPAGGLTLVHVYYA